MNIEDLLQEMDNGKRKPPLKDHTTQNWLIEMNDWTNDGRSLSAGHLKNLSL